ncbi:hypothetical protein VT06_12925 [Arsukibacterium sp. MJ3]|uniref:hypothetical protein n=1 Tax=Arsukibacterium sp. MJ3 TaxID=1632859 RepID=UPI0006273E27|nr:hypothetical protein [Arsukibacterium sp. MJ3]KKO48143.1 hypothetical protein VT06_12925 [Arsukibacterium sp. MJ3]
MNKHIINAVNLKPTFKHLLIATVSACSLFLAGCQTTPNKAPSVGPSIVGPSTVTQPGKFNNSSSVYLDVAIPVFDPGIPLDSRGNIDDKKVADDDIWPQVRRLEANRFAIDTKRALAATKAFGSISVTPNSSASADVYVLGKIIYSDTETVEISVRVIDATNDELGSKTFKHVVGEAFYRDALRANQNSYDPIFNDIARYVYDLINKKSDKQKTAIKQVSDLRYAGMYSPEAFSPYVTSKRKSSFSNDTVFKLTGTPSPHDPMLQRVTLLQSKDEQFVDQLQDSYEAFYSETDEAYRKYQRETLPVAAEIRENKAKRNLKWIGAGAALGAAILLDKNSNSDAADAGKYISVLAGVYSIAEAMKSNRELSAQRDVLSEMGQSLDIKITPQVIELNDQTIELQGTASEQLAQFRQRLLDIYQVEATPDIQL